MYNEKQKLYFLSSIIESERQPEISLFNDIEKKESFYKKDISEMDYDEAKDTLLHLGGRGIRSKSHQLSRLKLYINWCINNKITNNEEILNNFAPTDIINTSILSTKMVKDPEHLQELLDVVYESENEETRHNIKRMRFWFVYNGLTVKELTYLKKKDVDIEKNQICLKDRIIELMPETKRLVISCFSMDYYNVTVNGNNVRKPILLTEYAAMNYDNPTDQTRLTLIQMFSKFNNIYRKTTNNIIKLSPACLRDSGIYYRWYVNEKNKKPIDYEEYSELKTKQYDKISYNRKIKEIGINYESWKKAFELV